MLVTTSRLPFALEEIRKLGRVGHHVYASDTFRSAPGLHSKHVEKGFVTASPTYRPERFHGDIERIVREHPIERILPAFEEVFCLARHRERLERHAELFAPDFETLVRLHDKAALIALGRDLGLRVPETVVARSRDELAAATKQLPRYFARPAFSRGGVTLYTNAGPLAGAVPLEECAPTEENPFVVQPFVEGRDICTFAIAHHGRLAAHSTYVHPRMIEHSGGIVFESIEDDEVLAATRRVVEATGYHGQISLDYMRDDDGLTLVECNPRASAGLTVMPDAMLDAALCDRHRTRTLVAPAGARRKLSLGLIRNMVLDWREAPKDLEELLKRGKDVFADPSDIVPLLWQFIAYGHVMDYRLRTGHVKRTDLMQGYFHDVCWDGAPID